MSAPGRMRIQGASRTYLAPLQQTMEAELMHARIGETFARHLAQTNGAVWRRRSGLLAPVLVVRCLIAIAVDHRQMGLEEVANALAGTGRRNLWPVDR